MPHPQGLCVQAAPTPPPHTHTPQESVSLSAYFCVAKRIALYLARISPQHTIDHLAYEINLQV